MALATRCPACETIFRISTAQAAAKGGMVRCGQCRHVFNSLDALVRVEDLDVIEEGTAAFSQAGMGASAGGREAGTAEALSGALVTPPSLIESLVEEDDDPNPSERPIFGEWWLTPGPATPPPATASDGSSAVRVVASDDPPSLSRSRTGRRTGDDRPPVADGAGHPQFMRARTERPPPSRTERWGLVLLALFALSGLLAQGAYIWRDELSVRWPAARPWLVSACAALRCKVGYPAHPEAITIESTSVQSSGPNASLYVMNALLRNRDPVDIRYPFLELTLTDVQDEPVLRRTLRPEDYLVGRDPNAAFGAESELPVRVTFEVSNLRFAGYRLDRYYP